MTLNAAIEKFAQVFEASEKSLGVVEARPITIMQQSQLSLGPVLTEYYSRAHFEGHPDIGGAMHLQLYKIDELLTAQHGWRWITEKDGKTIENPNWKPSWIIIADRNGDAIVVDSTSHSGNVFGSVQQINTPIAGSLGNFLLTLAECMQIEKTEFNYEVKDDDFNVIQPFLTRVLSCAEKNLGIEYAKGFMAFFFE